MKFSELKKGELFLFNDIRIEDSVSCLPFVKANETAAGRLVVLPTLKEVMRYGDYKVKGSGLIMSEKDYIRF